VTEPVSILQQLEHDLQRAAERRPSTKRPAPPARRGWWRRRGVVLSVGLAALALVGAGGGLLLGTGRTLPPAFVLPANPAVGLGRPLPASLALLPMREADPAGGPPWGMRVIRTSRGLACVQAGRVVGGRLGGLGIGYAFKGDGLFHPFSPADAIAVDSCATVDLHGNAFQPGAPMVVTADGLPLAGENLYPGERVHCDLPGQEDWGIRCPQAHLREVAVGMLGPDATSIQVSAPGRHLTVTPYGPDGAYLIVLPAPPHANTGVHGLLGRRAPGTPTLTVTFRNGSTCRLPADTASQRCTPEGIVRSTGQLTPARLRRPVSVRYSPMIDAPAPLAVTAVGGRSSFPRNVGSASGAGPGLSVTFRAPVAAPNISSGYDVELEPQPRQGCRLPGTILSQPTQQTVAAGQRVRIEVLLESSCHTSYTGRVFFARSSGSYSEARTSENTDEGPLYEVIANEAIRARRGSAAFGVTVARFHITVP
jgi:hypothetical protein